MSRFSERVRAPFQLTAAATLCIALAALLAPPARAAGPPLITESFITGVTATGATLRAKINPNGFFTTYRFEYITEAAYVANVEAIPPKEGFAGATKIPSEKEPAGLVGSGTTPLEVSKAASGLTPALAYRFRVVASNNAPPTPPATTIGPEHAFATQEGTSLFQLPDNRAWELVSPPEKAGGAIAIPGSLFGGGAFQAAAGGGAIAYGSATAFGEPKGAPPASQYLSSRTPSGWSTQNVSAPLESAAYGDEPDGSPYRLFSSDLSQGLLFGGLPCRGGIAGCPAPNPVIAGSGAPSGFMAYYLRNASSGAYSSLLSASDLAHTAVSKEHFEVSLATASPDLAHAILSSCAALTSNATEVMLGPDECDPEEQNLYERSSSGLKLINLLPGDTTGTPGAEIAAPNGAISTNGSRIYWTAGGDLYLRDGTQSFQVDESQGGGGSFQVASPDGAVAFFTKEGHLYRFLASTKATTDLTPGGGVVGVLGASADGSAAFYQDATGIQRWKNATTTQVAAGAEASDESNYPPATGTSRVSGDGEHLVFLSDKELSGYDNAGQVEVYLWGPPLGGSVPQLLCASCNPTGERALGPASIPGALINGSTLTYRPRVLSENGLRLFFDSDVTLAIQDTNEHPDVYQWEANGIGDCQRLPGCLKLISSGRSPEGATFIDASADGSDVYFTTDGSLVSRDPGSIDLYDARVGGGLPEPIKPIPCIADACQSLPAPPEDPDPGTLIKSSGNPLLFFERERKKKKGKGKGKQGKGKKGKGKRKFGKGKYHVPVKREAKR